MSMVRWIDGKTAPRDGSLLLLYNSDQRVVEAGHWNPDVEGFEVSLGDVWQASDCELWAWLPYPKGRP